MNDLIDALRASAYLLGFASAGIAWAYIGSLLASLLCVIYGLVLWNKGRTGGSQRGRRVKRGRWFRRMK
jgi:hypothetical protein